MRVGGVLPTRTRRLLYVASKQGRAQDLIDINLTPIEEEGLEHYLYDPTMSRKGIFSCRIHFRSLISLFVILRNQELKQWLREEHIEVELNNLESIKTTNVGFFINCHPRDTILVEQTA